MSKTKSKLLEELEKAKLEWDLARARVDDEWYDIDIPLTNVLSFLDAVDELDDKEKDLASIIEEVLKLKAE